MLCGDIQRSVSWGEIMLQKRKISSEYENQHQLFWNIMWEYLSRVDAILRMGRKMEYGTASPLWGFGPEQQAFLTSEWICLAANRAAEQGI